MESRFKACYVVGKKFGMKATLKYHAKIKQFVSMIGVRSLDEELEELIRCSLELDNECEPLVEILICHSDNEKKLAIKQFLSGYIKGKVEKQNGK